MGGQMPPSSAPLGGREGSTKAITFTAVSNYTQVCMYIYFRSERLLISSFANSFFHLSAQIPKTIIEINIYTWFNCSYFPSRP